MGPIHHYRLGISQRPLADFKITSGHRDLLASLCVAVPAEFWLHAVSPLLPSSPRIHDPVSVSSSLTDAVSTSPNSLDTHECHVGFLPREWPLTENTTTL